MSRHTLKGRRSTARLLPDKSMFDEGVHMKPYGFCCSPTDYDRFNEYGKRRPPLKSTAGPIQDVCGSPAIKLHTEIIDSAEAERRRKAARAKQLPQYEADMMMPSSSTLSPIEWYLEDEIAQGRDALWKERQIAYNREADKNLAKAIKKTNDEMKKCSRMQNPKWYQDFSFEQMKNLACLERAISEDYEEMVTGRTQRALMGVGVVSSLFTLSGEVIRKLQKCCEQNVIEFLCEIYRILTGNYFEDEVDKESYDCNEKIILSGIAFLTFPETILELHRRLPPVAVPKLPPKPQPPVVPARKRLPCPYHEELFTRPDWATYLNNLQAWEAYCKLIPIPKVILPDESSIIRRPSSKTKNRETKRPISRTNARDSKGQSSKTNLVDKASKTSIHQTDRSPSKTSMRGEDSTPPSRVEEYGGSEGEGQGDPTLPRQPSHERHSSQLRDNRTSSQVFLEYEKYDIPRLPDENKVFNFTLNGVSEQSGPVEYKICGTLSPPVPHTKTWLGDKHAHYIISGAPNNPPTCPVTYEMTGVANVTPVNSDERFLSVLKIGDGPRKIYPGGRKNLSQNWQEWLQNADEEYKKLERQANKMIKNIEATMRLVFPGPTCDSCCSCRQTRKSHTKWKQTKAPYFVIDNLTEDEKRNKYIVGSLAMHSPAPSPAESTVNLLEVIASEDVVTTNLIISGVTNEKGETQYFITGSKKSMMHIPSRVVEPPPPPPLRNVPPCACAVHQIFNKGLSPRTSGDNIPWTKDDGRCYGQKFRPDEHGAYSCKKYPGDKSCRRNPFMLDIEKLKRKKAAEKRKKEKPDYPDKEKKMYSIADFKPCGDEHGDPICSGPWGAKHKLTPRELAELEKERKAILRGPPCGQKPGRAVCEGPFGARVPAQKRAKVETIAYAEDMRPEELALLEEEDEEEEEEEEEEKEEPPPKKEKPKIRDKSCYMSPESMAARTKVVVKKVGKFIPDPNYHGYDDIWNIYRTAPTEEVQFEPEYENSLKLSTPEARPPPKKEVVKEVKEVKEVKKESDSESTRTKSSSTSVAKKASKKLKETKEPKKQKPGKKGPGAPKATSSRSTLQSVPSLRKVKSQDSVKKSASFLNRPRDRSSDRSPSSDRSKSSKRLSDRSPASDRSKSSKRLSDRSPASDRSKGSKRLVDKQSSTSARKMASKLLGAKGKPSSKTGPSTKHSSSDKSGQLKPGLGHTRIDRPTVRRSRERKKKARDPKGKPVSKSGRKLPTSSRKLSKQRSLSGSRGRSRNRSPGSPGRLGKKSSTSIKSTRKPNTPVGKLSPRSGSRSPSSKSGTRSPSSKSGTRSPGKSGSPRTPSPKSGTRTPSPKSGSRSLVSKSGSRPASLKSESRSPSRGSRARSPSPKSGTLSAKSGTRSASPKSGSRSPVSSGKTSPGRSQSPPSPASGSKGGKGKRKKRGKRKRTEEMSEEARKQERQRLKTMMNDPGILPMEVEPAEVPVEPRLPCKHDLQDDKVSVASDPSVAPSESNIAKRGPCGWRTKSEQKLQPKTNLAYLADKDEDVEVIPVREGGKPCTCREMRNKKKVLMYAIGGVMDKEKVADTKASKLLKKKKDEDERKDTHVIEGAHYFTPPPSPRRSEEYIPEYDLLQSPYDMCTSKRKDTNLKLIEQTAGPRELTAAGLKKREPCGCNDYIDSYGLLDPDSPDKAKALEEIDRTKQQLVEGKSAEERWYRAFKDAGLIDYFTRCKHNLPCWLKCSSFNKHGCGLKYRQLKMKRPVCECKYERKVLEHREEKVNWKKRQQRLKSLKKQPYMSVVNTARPIEADTKLLISNVKRIPQDDEYVDDVKYCITGVAENYTMLPPQQVVDGMKMLTPVHTPAPSKEKFSTAVHRHWSPIDIPAGPLPRKDADIIADKKRRQKALEEAYKQIYAPVPTRDPHGTHTCEATCNPEEEEEGAEEEGSDSEDALWRKINMKSGGYQKGSNQKKFSLHGESRCASILQSKSGSRSESRSGSKSESRSGSRSESRSGTKSDSRYGSRSESRSASRSGSRPDSGSGSRPDSGSGSRSESRSASKAESRPGSRSESKAESRSGSRSESRSKSKTERGISIKLDSTPQVHEETLGEGQASADSRPRNGAKDSISSEEESGPKEERDELMVLAEAELSKMAEEGFLFAKLPECFKHPQLQDWLLYRKGVIYTEEDKHDLMRKTVVMWNMMSTVAVPPVEPPPLSYSDKQIRNLTFASIEKVKKEITEKKAIFHSNVRKARVAFAHSMWESMEYRKFPTKSFKEAYFTYMASKEADGHVFRPWFLSEVREKPRKQ